MLCSTWADGQEAVHLILHHLSSHEDGKNLGVGHVQAACGAVRELPARGHATFSRPVIHRTGPPASLTLPYPTQVDSQPWVQEACEPHAAPCSKGVTLRHLHGHASCTI